MLHTRAQPRMLARHHRIYKWSTIPGTSFLDVSRVSHIWHKISRQIPTTTTTANVFYVIIVEVQLPWAFLGHSHLRCSEHVNIFAFFGWSSFIWASGKYKTTGKPPSYLLLPPVAAHFFHGDLHAGWTVCFLNASKFKKILTFLPRRFQTGFPQPSARFAQSLMFTEPKM